MTRERVVYVNGEKVKQRVQLVILDFFTVTLYLIQLVVLGTEFSDWINT